MKTIWKGDSLILEFAGRNVVLTIDECKEFDKWVIARVENAVRN